MITKVKRIVNVGKFYDYCAKGEGLDWHKNTFVFAPNAYGKSTLVNVFRSLRENDPKLIRARRTLGKRAAPEAVVVVDATNHVFNGTQWDKPLPSIQIFDAPFIHANILAHEIEHEHRKNIHRIIIGARGIKLAEELASLKTKEKLKSQEVAKLVAQFNRAGFGFSLDQFLAIAPGEESAVGPRIQKLERDIKSKQSETVVRGLGLPRQVSPPSFDVEGAKVLATKTLADVHEAAKQRVLTHVERNFKDKSLARQFIRQGLDLLQADCPFCGQDLTNAAQLLEAYRQFFDEAFKTYQSDVAKQVVALEHWNLDNDLTALVSAHNANPATLRQWQPYLGAIVLPDLAATIESERSRLVELKSLVKSELEAKQRDPSTNANLSHFDALTAGLGALKSAIEGYNTSVTAFADSAKQYVSNLPKSDIASIQAALAKEQQVKARFTPEWKQWAKDYPAAKKEAEELLALRNAKLAELQTYGKGIFDTYQKRINELLVALGADFAITGLVGKMDERANESYSDFGFLILQQQVPLTTRQDDAPCFRNTLSEGDKSTLAFAFFIAALEKTPDLDKQVVIFDDPLSSLDETRREATARLLLDLSPKLNQLCVFTHNKDFLWMLFDKIVENRVFRIRSDKANGSRIEPFDVEQDRKSDYVRMVEEMERYVNEDFGASPDHMQGDIRRVFEVVLKTKYYRALATDIKTKKGLAKLLETLFGAGLLPVDLKRRLFDLCNVTNGPHHGEIVDAPSRKLTRDELIL